MLQRTNAVARATRSLWHSPLNTGTLDRLELGSAMCQLELACLVHRSDGMRMTMFAGCVTFALTACGEANTSIDRQVESQLTIASGVYGQTTSVDDVGSNSPQYFPMTLSVFNSEDHNAALANARSDERGFYEIQLSPGEYTICTSFDRCTPLPVSDGQCIRLDYEFSVGPGWSAPRVRSCAR